MEAAPNVITPEVVAQGLSFTDYIALTRQVVAEGKTTGLEQSSFLAQVTKDNLSIMERTYQTPLESALIEKLQQLEKPQLWLVLTEGWCGDAAQYVPILAALAEKTDKVTLKTILRSEQPAVMDAYLTNGGKSIPKLIALDADTLQPLGSWGPRPQIMQEYVLDLKKQELPLPEFIKLVHQRAEDDAGHALQAELLNLIPVWANTFTA